MASLKIKTKNQIETDQKPKVYFTCHPDDFDKYFEKICGYIFDIFDCAIYYADDLSESLIKAQNDFTLYPNTFIIVPVTHKLITTPNIAMNEDIAYAKQKHIPILPIVMEPGLEELYLQPDNFGEIGYLKQYNININESSFEERIKKLLESVRIDVEINKYIFAANAAYIMSNFDEAREHYEHIYSLRCKLMGEKDSETLSTLSAIAHLNHQIGDKEKILEFDIKRYALFCEALGENHLETIKMLHEVANSYLQLGNKEKALEQFEKSYEICYKTLGEEDFYTIVSLNSAAYVCFNLGKKEEALKLYQKLQPVCNRILGEDHKITIGVNKAVDVIPKMLAAE